MMKFLTIILLLFLSFPALCQLKIEEKSKQQAIKSESDIKEFVTENHFDYALLVWQFDWIGTYSNVNGLFKQQGNWYLAKITTGYNNPLAKLAFTINQRQLNKAEVDSVLRLLNPTQAFKYNQEDFDKLPLTYQFLEKNGDVVEIIQPSDGSPSRLLQLCNQEIKTLSFDSPDTYVKDFYPHSDQYGILKGFTNTIELFSNLTKNLSKK